jgi:hypothetical protein
VGTSDINQTLLALLDNQVARTEAAFADLPEAAFDRTPGGDCNSIAAITRHLVMLRRFQLGLLGSPLAQRIADPESLSGLDASMAALTEATALLRTALAEHDPGDWHVVSDPPRPGPWAEDPTLTRFTRPFNDFVNHLGAIRAIRRILECPAANTQ